MFHVKQLFPWMLRVMLLTCLCLRLSWSASPLLWKLKLICRRFLMQMSNLSSWMRLICLLLRILLLLRVLLLILFLVLLLILKITKKLFQMKKNKVSNILKAISALITFIAGLITGGTTPVIDNISNFLN